MRIATTRCIGARTDLNIIPGAVKGMVLSEDQRKLLLRLKRSSLSFTGQETDAQRLAMLQLYMSGLVIHSTKPEHQREFTWLITCKGEACVAR